MRVAVVDIGTNSTRLLIAEVDPAKGDMRELVRRSTVTRLGDGVDAGGSLSQAAIDRVCATLEGYEAQISEQGAERNLAVLTSAVRDASNGGQFTEMVRERFHLDARTLTGDEEAQLTFQGAMSDRHGASLEAATVVVDIGGGSTEFILGRERQASFHTSLQAGVVRMSERHIHADPPTGEEIAAIEADTHATFEQGLPESVRGQAERGIAVAGTATSAGAIAQELDPYDPARVHGYELRRAEVSSMLGRLAAMDEARRRQVKGLHPDRAPTIVAGMILLGQAMDVLGLDCMEVSEHDILRGGALRLAGVS